MRPVSSVAASAHEFIVHRMTPVGVRETNGWLWPPTTASVLQGPLPSGPHVDAQGRRTDIDGILRHHETASSRGIHRRGGRGGDPAGACPGPPDRGGGRARGAPPHPPRDRDDAREARKR